MKPNFYDILDIDSSRATADLTVEAIDDVPEYFKEVLDFSLNEKPPMCWRAARAVALSAKRHPFLFLPYADHIAQLYSSFKNDGLKRIFAGILSNYINYISDENKSVLIETCFNYMLSDEKVAVKYNCMKLLYALTKVIPELKGELMAAIDFNISEGVFNYNGELKRIYQLIDIQIK